MSVCIHQKIAPQYRSLIPRSHQYVKSTDAGFESSDHFVYDQGVSKYSKR